MIFVIYVATLYSRLEWTFPSQSPSPCSPSPAQEAPSEETPTSTESRWRSCSWPHPIIELKAPGFHHAADTAVLSLSSTPGHPVLHSDQDRDVAVEGRGRHCDQPCRHHADHGTLKWLHIQHNLQWLLTCLKKKPETGNWGVGWGGGYVTSPQFCCISSVLLH